MSPLEKIVPLIGRKSVLKCSMNGYAITALLDTGADVSIVDREWTDKYLPGQEICSLSELMEEELSLTAVTGDDAPYDGWTEVVVNLQGNNDPDLVIKVPFLVSSLRLQKPIIGFNVIHELVKSNESRPKVISILVSLPTDALEIDSVKAEAIVSFIQAEEKQGEQHTSLGVGRKEITIYPGQVANVKCRVPSDISDSYSLGLF